MALSIGELVGTISLQDNFSGPIKDVGGALGLTGESFGAIASFAGIATGAIVGATGAIVALGTRGAQVADVQGAFQGLTARAGESADVMLGRLREGTLGTVADFDLMQMANSALGSGLVRTADDMGTLAAGASLLADRTGGDAKAAFNTLTEAMEKGKAGGLKSLGVFVDMKGAVEAHAAAIGKDAKDLTEHERAAAINQATLAALKRELDAAGPATADFGDQIQRGKVAVQNFTDNLGLAIATSPVVTAGMSAIAEGVAAAFGGKQTDMVKTLMGFVNDFAIRLVGVAQGAVTGAGLFISAWHGIQTVILGVITAVSGTATAIVALVDGIVDLAMKVPGASSLIGGMASGTEQLRLKMEGATLSLAAQTAEAARGVLGNSELHRSLDGVSNTLAVMKVSMEAVRDTQGNLLPVTETLTRGIGDMGTAVGLTAAQIRAMEEQTMLSLGLMAESWTNAANLQAELQNQISVLQTTGLQQRLLELDLARQAEIAGIQHLAFEYPAMYEGIVAVITEKYALMAGIATGANLTIAQSAAAAGFQTRASYAETADKARELWADMVASGQFSAEEIRKAWERAEEAKRAATAATTTFTIGSVGDMLTATASLLQAFGVNFKALAIAGAVIAGISAIQKALAAPPGWPFNAAAVISVGIAQAANVMRIRSSPPGYAMGTPDTRFVDFGRVSTIDVHGKEAIVTPKQGASLAEMVEDELKARDTRTSDEIRELREEMALDRRLLKINLRDAVLLGLAGA